MLSVRVTLHIFFSIKQFTLTLKVIKLITVIITILDFVYEQSGFF
jgi:hypothetical protein